MNETMTVPGTLYLSATPIGNLEDMTYRSVRILGEVGLIAAEDTRHTRKLLAHYDIHTPLTSYHEHNKLTKGPELIAYLQGGGDLVCVSDAGLPGIADPGSHLAGLAIAAGIRVTPLPGANAALSALIFNALIIPALIPLALRGIHFAPTSASALLLRNLLVYGVGGVILPFVGIKAIDVLLSMLIGV